MSIQIESIPVLNDNYAWHLYSSEAAIIFDPGEAAPIEAFLQDKPLTAICITHHHADHLAGAVRLRERYKAPIYGPTNISHLADHLLKGGETLNFNDIKLQVYSSPGHAKGHITFYNEAIPALMSGDVLFSGGCGRLFEGTAAELFHSLRVFDHLPDQTLLCAGHEYTQSNMNFIDSLGIKSEAFLQRKSKVEELRAKNKPTLPVTLGEERAYNPFLRAKTIEEFAHIRKLKDVF
ncbi:hydroxyacylglutathione hydrolase [Aristophania vespae]|uniref:hydroxyacylglutathione hydrolase n=1 Tax=Aristophania vespae TaxID=2697033 RepID=UPI0023511A7F|nr:hydroxyacylglutathione hydrolase [Aristophania vespae]UMM63542.1 Hydroxyacylglutathione hydrolase [Aristophania vespae]